MTQPTTKDPRFLSNIEQWLRDRGEILFLIRYSRAAGSRDFELFVSIEAVLQRLKDLAPQTSVIAFRERQLPIRGVVDDEFIAECLRSIPDGAEYVIVDRARWVAGKHSWLNHCAGEGHAELRAELEDLRGATVAAGFYPPWLEDNEDVISAIVPNADGSVTVGCY